MRFNGHIVGVRNIPTSSGATGVFSLTEHELYVLGTAWPTQYLTPPIYSLDPYFYWNNGLLVGTGTSSNTNLTVTDSSVTALTFSRTGSPRQTSFNPFGTTDGSIFCNGSSYQTFPASSNWDFGSGSFTIEMWVYPILSAAETTFVEHGWAGSGALNYGFRAGTNSSYQLVMYANGTSYAFTDLIIPSATWTHVAWVGVGGVLYAYKNGIRSTVTGSYTSIVDRPSATLIIGGFNNNNENIAERYFYTGYISNLRIVKGSAVYTNTFSPPSAPLTAVSGTVLLTAQVTSATSNNAFYDLSSNHATTTNVNNSQVALTPFGMLTTSGSQYFNGSTDFLQKTTPATTLIDWYTSNFTLEYYIYPTAFASGTNSESTVIGNVNDSGLSAYWSFGPISTGAVKFYYYNGAQQSIATSVTIPTNVWTHLAFVKSGTSLAIYINGVSSATGTVSGTPQSGSGVAFTIGAATGGKFTGYLSNIRLVNGSAVYTGAFKAPIKPFDHTSATTLAACYTDTTNVATDSSVITNTKLLLKTADANFTANTILNNNTFIDSSVYAYPINATGAVAQGTLSPFAPDGESWSIEFNGSNSYISTTATSSNYTLSTGDWTIEYWAYHKALKDVNTLLSLGVGGSELYYALTSGMASGAIQFGTGSGSWGWTQQYTGTTGAIVTNRWQHIAIVRYNGNLYFYVDGVNKGISNSFNFGSGGSGGFYIGTYFANQNNDGSFWDGIVSNLRIVKGTALYTANNFTVPTSPLITVANTTLLTASSNRFRDTSNNNVTFAITGIPKVIRYNPFNSTVAYANTVIGGSIFLPSSGSPVPSLTASIPQFSTKDYTCESWIYPTKTNQSTIFNISGGALQIFVSSSTLYVYNSGSQWSYGSVPTNAWTHIAITRRNGNVTWWINGANVGATTIATDYGATNATFTLGTNGGGGDWFGGYISNARITLGTALYLANNIPATTASLTSTGPLQQQTILALDFTNAAIPDSSMMGDYTTNGLVQVSNSVGNPQGAGYALRFPGGSDYLSTPLGLNYYTMYGDYTAEMWIYPTTVGGTYYLFTLGTETTARMNFHLVNGVVTTNLYGGSSTTHGGSISINTWTHIAFVRSSGTLTAYVNGVPLATTFSSSATHGNGTLKVGSDSSGTSTFSGYMSNFRISKGARYTSNFSSTLPYGMGLFGAVPATPVNRAIFTSSGTWTVPASVSTINILVVGGGGGGGTGNDYRWPGGGGGAGGYQYQTGVTVTPGAIYPVIVGAGGAGGANSSNGNPGGDSSAVSILSIGGGRGATSSQTGGSGGSGGGGGGNSGSGGSGISGQGNNGGTASYYGSGGGGGSSGAGGDGIAGTGTTNSISGTTKMYSVGGAASGGSTSAPEVNTGSGGGGRDAGSGPAYPGASGVVIITW
jgi:hypothetical protein